MYEYGMVLSFWKTTLGIYELLVSYVLTTFLINPNIQEFKQKIPFHPKKFPIFWCGQSDEHVNAKLALIDENFGKNSLKSRC